MHCFLMFPIQGIQRRGDGKDCAPLSSVGEGGEVGEPRNLFPHLGIGLFCTGDAWNLPSEGTGAGRFWLVSPAEGTSALALVQFSLVHALCVHGQTCTHNTSSVPPPPPSSLLPSSHTHHHPPTHPPTPSPPSLPFPSTHTTTTITTRARLSKGRNTSVLDSGFVSSGQPCRRWPNASRALLSGAGAASSARFTDTRRCW